MDENILSDRRGECMSLEEELKIEDQHPSELVNLKLLVAEDNPTHKVLLSYMLSNELGIKEITYARDG